MTIHIRSHRAGHAVGHAVGRAVARHRHVFATGIASIVLALQPLTSLELRRFVAARTELSLRTTALEVSVHLCIARAGCGSLAVHVGPP
jgi:hypothetical protein